MSVVIDRRLSFSAGEFSPWTDPRIDLDKYRHACRRCRNIRPTVYGGAFSRPGTTFIKYQRDEDKSVRLVPFEFNVTNTLIVEFGEGYCRFFTTGDAPGPVLASPPLSAGWATAEDYEAGFFFWYLAEIYYVRENHTSTNIAADLAAGKISKQTEFEVPSPYAEEDLDGIQFAQLNDLVFVSHPKYPPRVLTRATATQWTFVDLDLEWPALLPVNRTATTIDPSATTGLVDLVATTPIFNAGHIGSRWIIQHRREDPTVTINLKTEAQGATTAQLYVLGEWSASIKAAVTGGEYEANIVIERKYPGGSWETLRLLSSTRASVQRIIVGTELEPAWLRIRYILKTNPTGIPNGLTAELEAVDPTHYGIVEIRQFTNDQSVKAQVLWELGASTATQYWQEASWSHFRGWPRSITIHEDRLWFGGTSFQPQTVWGSVIDDFGNFRLGSDADLAVELKASSDRANGIQWLASKDGLITGTTGSEWIYGSRDQSTIISAESKAVRRTTGYGSAHIQPIVAQESVLFIQKGAMKMREFTYTFEQDGYVAQDLTLLSEHITDDGIRQVAHQRQPETLIWCVTHSGRLIGLVYERGQNVAGWYRYDTMGTFESVASVSGVGEEDEVWVSVRRVIDGTPRRMIRSRAKYSMKNSTSRRTDWP